MYLDRNIVVELDGVGNVEKLVVDGGVVSTVCDHDENINITRRGRYTAGNGAKEIERINGVSEVVASAYEEICCRFACGSFDAVAICDDPPSSLTSCSVVSLASSIFSVSSVSAQ